MSRVRTLTSLLLLSLSLVAARARPPSARTDLVPGRVDVERTEPPGETEPGDREGVEHRKEEPATETTGSDPEVSSTAAPEPGEDSEKAKEEGVPGKRTGPEEAEVGEATSGPPPPETILPEPAGDPERLFREGLAAAEAGDHQTALDLLERVVVATPENLRYSAEYRQVVIAAEAYDRSIRFFEALAEEHPRSAPVFLNWGYAYVDKIPAAGAVTQVILADRALKRFTSSLEREVTWLGLYTRGNSYIYWPPIFGRTPPGIADLERAIELAEDLEHRPYRALAWVALGDGYWRLDDLDRAREIWRKGLDRYPGHPDLEARLSREDDEELRRFLESEYEIGKRVETHLRQLWSEGEEKEE